jgi:hypothetical protein
VLSSAPAHARPRTRLGRCGTARLAALNTGTVFLALGIPTGTSPLVVVGGALVDAAVGASLALAAGAVGDLRDVPATAQR